MFFLVLFFDDVSFFYLGDVKDDLYKYIDFGFDMDFCIVLVGFNGVGKFIFFWLMIGKFFFREGVVLCYIYLKLGLYL